MPNYFSLLIFCHCIIFSFEGKSQQLNDLQKVNHEIAKLFAEGNTEKLLSYYAEEAVAMPEYHKPLYGKPVIRQYFNEWMKATGKKLQVRKVIDVQSTPHYVIEIGTLTDRYLQKGKDSMNYDCKYLRVWKKGPDRMNIISEIWGANDYIEKAKLPEIKIQPAALPKSTVSATVQKEIGLRNQTITDCVKERKGAEHATLFTKDAIYMPYFQPMKKGIENVKAYFVDHEGPGVAIDSLVISAANIIDLGNNIVLEHGYYAIRWRSDTHGGLNLGKSVNIWKKDDSGQWKLFRQMVNHDE
ncbi:DUF4440 domain-containing protein [Chitinophaga silvatica]|uniref:DUF4440 domain-containing protein n=1 Tax=Chitinophaga silvatica TaxID=2282649 RepID=A0A3E1Y8L7_9BACT|nr:nuclear transport factor 2 family protein [Chitinophaga silvatica]RFS21789.1 DUF4440 domain-containing protein [Chitinophaga silvatica]